MGGYVNASSHITAVNKHTHSQAPPAGFPFPLVLLPLLAAHAHRVLEQRDDEELDDHVRFLLCIMVWMGNIDQAIDRIMDPSTPQTQTSRPSTSTHPIRHAPNTRTH